MFGLLVYLDFRGTARNAETPLAQTFSTGSARRLCSYCDEVTCECVGMLIKNKRNAILSKGQVKVIFVTHYGIIFKPPRTFQMGAGNTSSSTP